MKMQIWKIHIVEGVIGAVHGFSHQIYEAFVPNLCLSINHVTSFVNEGHSRYEKHDEADQLVASPPPEMICEIELSRAQIEDMKILASEDNPEDRARQLIQTTLKDYNLDASDYEKEKEEAPKDDIDYGEMCVDPQISDDR